jgi:outer membrane protein TolC
MKRSILLLAFLLMFQGIHSQEVRLSECISLALKNNPLSGNRELAVDFAGLRKQVIKAAWLPTLDLNAQATWQTDVVSFTLDLPFEIDFPVIPKDQYKATLDVTQMIYDGGGIKAQQVIEDISASVTGQEIAIKEYSLVETIEDLFFAILNVNRRLEVFELMDRSIEATLNQVKAAVGNGVLSESDYATILAEKIRIRQLVIQTQGLKNKAVRAMETLTGMVIPNQSRFIIPDEASLSNLVGARPELSLFNLQAAMFDARIRQLTTQLRPKLVAFGQAGYGKPGLNFLGDTWDPYAIIGIKFSWTLWDWGKIRKQKESFDISRRMLDNQRKAFEQQQAVSEIRQLETIEELNSLLISDYELVGARERITATYQSKLNGGIVTGPAYLTEWTKEQEAKITLEARRLERLAAQYKLVTIKGKNI